jgi:hypothetical protein
VEPVSKPSKKTASQTTETSLNGSKSTKRNKNLASLRSTGTPPPRSVKSKVVFTIGEEQLKRTEEGRTNLWAGYETEHIIRDDQVQQESSKMTPFWRTFISKIM